MAEHVSLEGFWGGFLLGGLVVGFSVGFRTYWIWGKGRNAIEAALRAARTNEAAAQANEAATAQDRLMDRAEYERKLAATQKAAQNDREQDRADYESELAATRTAAEKDREQDRAKYEKELSTALESYDRAHAEATWRSLSVSRTDWHDSLHSLTDGRLPGNMD